MAPKIQSTQKAVPKIYCYETPTLPENNGWVKIGYTEQEVEKRINQQLITAGVQIPHKTDWALNAIFDHNNEPFTDKAFHHYLVRNKVEKRPKREWFKISGNDSKLKFYDFRENGGILETDYASIIPYRLREEQEKAVRDTQAYLASKEQAEFLWNAKPRFGKTLTAYDLCKTLGAQKVLIVTNRPAIANSWYDDYAQFMGTQSGYYFVSETEALHGKAHCITRKQYIEYIKESKTKGIIEFLSLQDLKGSLYFGGKFDKLRHVKDMQWDLLIIDEAHEGVDTLKTDVAFEQITRKYTLHLSGTPFKALANAKFEGKAIYNYTYADEQTRKENWEKEHPDEDNPYIDMPRLNLWTYQMSEMVREKIEEGVVIDDEQEEYTFDLNKFFETKSDGTFWHSDEVDHFLDALTTQEKYPFSTDELRKELKHTFWLLDRVDSAKSLKKKLQAHPVFKDYEIVLAAGEGDEDTVRGRAFDSVKTAIKNHDKTITLSVGMLTTGVTIPEWTGVLMLCNCKSPSLYMQAAFRAQNPCLFQDGAEFYRKTDCYVFDFDPARTLRIYEQFANDLSEKTVNGAGDTATREENVRVLLNLFPVIGEDSEGKMVQLNEKEVLSIPSRIYAKEVVRRGFMSDFLFTNISHIFAAPSEVIDILKKVKPAKKDEALNAVTNNTAVELSLDENGEVSLDNEWVIGQAKDVFGTAIYGMAEAEKVEAAIEQVVGTTDNNAAQLQALKNAVKNQVIAPVVTNDYTSTLGRAGKQQLEKTVTLTAELKVDKAYAELTISSNENKIELEKALEVATTQAQVAQANEIFAQKQAALQVDFTQTIQQIAQEISTTAQVAAVEAVETKKREVEKKTIEDDVRDHLRGFSRTIPSFLMAYGDEAEVTLESFDTIIPDEVFIEVTSITLEQFRFLRDGGDFIDQETGEIKHYAGHLFNEIIFNDSVREFLNKRAELANYFDETQTEDIFNYIPPQKTNQIFTPKKVVVKMVDMLEEENPGCYDAPNHTFIDLYMKSGQYITEIVKRLYNSPVLREKFPDEKARLQHIFEKQVFGLAPTEIIYRIATNYILGFADNDFKHNFRLLDALPLTQAGTLESDLDEIFGE